MVRSTLKLMAAGAALMLMAQPSYALTEDDVRAAYQDEYGNAVLIGKSGYKLIRVGGGADLVKTIRDTRSVSYKHRPECTFVGMTVRGRSYMYGSGDITPVIGKWVCE